MKELIEALQKLPANALVVVDDRGELAPLQVKDLDLLTAHQDLCTGETFLGPFICIGTRG